MPAKASKSATKTSTRKPASPAAPVVELNPDTMVAAARERRAGLPFDPKNAGGGKSPTAYQPAERYGVAAHGGSASEVPLAIDTLVRPLVDRAQINGGLLLDGALKHPWELYFQGFLDGYASLQAVTPAPKKAPRRIGSKAAVTQFVKSALEASDVALTGPLAPTFEALLGEYFTLHGQGLRKPTAAAFVAGARLRCLECGLELEPLFNGPKRERGAAIPKGKAAPHQDLLGAVLANPGDDAPRLVYADYLTTHDDPRGEFIALQIAVGNVAGYEEAPPTRPVENADKLVKRIDTLLKASRGKWVEGVKLSTISYARGFPVKAGAEAVEFLENANIDKLPLETIKLIHWNAKLAEATFKRKKHPTLRRFWFGSGFGPKILHVLGAPVFADAVQLEAGFWDEAPIPERALEVLSKTVFKNLEVVEATDELFAALALASCPRLQTLKSSSFDFKRTSTTPLWRQVKRLEVFRMGEAPELSTLASAQSLERLTMVTQELGEAGVHQLIELAPKSLTVLEGGFVDLAPELTNALRSRFELRALAD